MKKNFNDIKLRSPERKALLGTLKENEEINKQDQIQISSIVLLLQYELKGGIK